MIPGINYLFLASNNFLAKIVCRAKIITKREYNLPPKIF
ncbi:hypothetical protein RINTHM_7120 [Richelia intracellularis HM01]|nr:hypothetical protein RINTHM_7120 [Richelia intracellularis HM01]